jgi:hypothetical protein
MSRPIILGEIEGIEGEISQSKILAYLLTEPSAEKSQPIFP